APHGALRFLPLQLRCPRPSDGCKEESPTLSVKMKWDFNYYHVHSGIKPVKPDDRRQGSYTTAYLEGSYIDCIKDYERLSDFGSPIVSPSFVELETESKPWHNKENQHVRHLTVQMTFRIFADQDPNKNLLPALHSEKVVCSTLKQKCKQNPKIDWEKLREFISSGNFRLRNIIGRKTGLKCVDILSELFRRGLRHPLANILTQLSDMDLINASKVSTTWKKIREDDKGALQLYNKAIQRITIKKRNMKFH
ncbi:hypothetical protein E2I00_015993, partial [Balaenoptera physalus]